jgi:probable addiction module antidote protein
MVELYDHDPAEVLDTPEGIAAFLTDAFASGDRAFIAHALGVAARARGMTELARETGLSRSNLYDAFNEEGNPTLETMLKLLKALGVDLAAKPHSEVEAD